MRRGDVQEGWEKLGVTAQFQGTDLSNLYDSRTLDLSLKLKTISQEMKFRIFQRENKTSFMSGQEHWAGSTCACEHGYEDLCMFGRCRNLYIYITIISLYFLKFLLEYS